MYRPTNKQSQKRYIGKIKLLLLALNDKILLSLNIIQHVYIIYLPNPYNK